MGLVVGSACVAPEETTVARQSLSLNDRITACTSDPRVVAGTVSVDVCVGADLFFRETFGGNGRSCATCHRVDHNLTIDPAFIATLPANDPLFVAEFNPDLAGLEIPAQMRGFGLILENVDGFAPDPRTHFVLRSVPHTLSLATSVTRAAGDPVTPPAERTGWSGDGAPGGGSCATSRPARSRSTIPGASTASPAKTFASRTTASSIGSISSCGKPDARTSSIARPW